jgi:hypothetical protein
MDSITHQNRVAKTVAVLLFVVTAFTWKSGTDPVNIPKEFILVIGAFYLFGLSVLQLNRVTFSETKSLILCLVFFMSALVLSFVFSEAPKTHQLFGVYGRALGLLTYLSFALLCYVIAINRSASLMKWIEVSLHASFFYNSIICIFQISGIELLGYNNIFKSVLGTFGNPNFVSAFLGIFVSWVMSHLISKKTSRLVKSLVLAEIILAIFLIIKSNSRQGLIIIGFSIILIIYFHIRSSQNLIRFVLPYRFLAGILSFLIGLGVFNIGPLADLIYKVSISLRMQYWKAAIHMLEKNLLNGVGLNSYGDWYREARDPSALVSPGIDIVTNSAHNIPLDFGATGGLPLVVSYIAIQLVVLRAIFRLSRQSVVFNREHIALISSWVAFTLQSLISIDQIGVSIWGWAISGLIIAANRNLEHGESGVKKNERRAEARKVLEKSTSLGPLVLAPTFAIVGLIIVLPAFRADLAWGKAITTGDINQIKSAADAWPQDEMRYGTAAFIFGNNKIWDEALVYARKTLEFNPRSYAVWRMILNNPRADLETRRIALEKMRALDPNNKTLSDELLTNVGGK